MEISASVTDGTSRVGVDMTSVWVGTIGLGVYSSPGISVSDEYGIPAGGRDKKPDFHIPKIINPKIANITKMTPIMKPLWLGTVARRYSGKGLFRLLSGTGQLIKFLVRQCVA